MKSALIIITTTLVILSVLVRYMIIKFLEWDDGLTGPDSNMHSRDEGDTDEW